MTDSPALVVGLGNPGPQYARTRHNIGFWVVEVLADRAGARFSAHKRSNSDVAETRLVGRRAAISKPRTYMNESGGPVANAAKFFSVSPADIVVVHDDLELDLGVVKLKAGGGEGGHNGLRSISKSLGDRMYPRVRVGIGRPPGRQDPADYVLKPFGAADRAEVELACELAADAVEDFLAGS